ncbi:MAG: endonuclease III [Pseudomonadota bacterium]|jgi:endonuclease-3
MTPRKRAELLAILAQLYPEPRSELAFSNDFELIIAVMLSAQCTDVKVNQVTPILFKKFPSAARLAKAKLSDVEKIIRPINYFKTKSRNIIATSEILTAKYDGAVPRTHEELTALPGVGRKTANVVLGETGAVPALPVDTHVFRVARRLGLSSSEDTEGVERDLMKQFPSSEWRPLHHRLIFHGRRVCKARNPQCDKCALRQLCPNKPSLLHF